MKKFGEYITESQDHTITEERLRLIDEAVARSVGRVVGRLGSRLKGGLKTYGADVGSEMKKSLGQGLGFDIADRIGRIGRRKKYIQPQFQQSQLPGGEKLQPRSSGGY